MKKGILIFSLLIAAAATVLICYLLVQEVSHKKSRLDIPDLENNWIVSMFNAQIDRQIQNHTQSIMYPGYIPESRSHIFSKAPEFSLVKIIEIMLIGIRLFFKRNMPVGLIWIFKLP